MDNVNNWIYFDKRYSLKIEGLQEIGNALTRIADELEKSNKYTSQLFEDDIKENAIELQ